MTETPIRTGAYCVADSFWDFVSSHATRDEAVAACPPECHVLYVADATPGTLGGLSGSPFADYMESLERRETPETTPREWPEQAQRAGRR